MPAPLLTHLTSKAVETKMMDGDTMELTLSKEMENNCLKTETILIRTLTGAPIYNTVEHFCGLKDNKESQ